MTATQVQPNRTKFVLLWPGHDDIQVAQCQSDNNFSRTLTPTASRKTTKHSIDCALHLLKKSCPVHIKTAAAAALEMPSASAIKIRLARKHGLAAMQVRQKGDELLRRSGQGLTTCTSSISAQAHRSREHL